MALRPDLVVANGEENRESGLAALREARADVLVAEVRTLGQAFTELERVLGACGPDRPGRLDEAAWAAAPWPGTPRTAIVAVRRQALAGAGPRHVHR